MKRKGIIMSIELSVIEARVIGCLIEKEITTPDYYPLTLNSLTTACNQKSNREPITSYSEVDILDTTEGLIVKRLVSNESRASSRVNKYQHRFCNTEFGDLKFSSQELAVICCLLLRGAQTPGELRTRTNRLCQFDDVKETETVLDHLVRYHFVSKLERESGKRESRYVHLFSKENVPEHVFEEALHDNVMDEAVVGDYENRMLLLEREVSELKREMEQLKNHINDID